jgi:hypothetical protein
MWLGRPNSKFPFSPWCRGPDSTSSRISRPTLELSTYSRDRGGQRVARRVGVGIRGQARMTIVTISRGYVGTIMTAYSSARGVRVGSLPAYRRPGRRTASRLGSSHCSTSQRTDAIKTEFGVRRHAVRLHIPRLAGALLLLNQANGLSRHPWRLRSGEKTTRFRGHSLTDVLGLALAGSFPEWTSER